MKLLTPQITSPLPEEKKEVFAFGSLFIKKPRVLQTNFTLLLLGFAIFFVNLYSGYFGLNDSVYSGNQRSANPDYMSAAPPAASSMMPISSGNLMFSHVNSDGTERFSIVTTVAILSGTTVTVTDNEWDGISFDADGDDEIYVITFTTNAPCGTEYIFTDDIAPTSNNGSGVTINDNSFDDLEAAGDALYLIDGLYSAPNFISAISFGTGAWGSNGNLPATLTNDVTALDFASDNGDYLCGLGTLAITIMNETYWNTSNTAINPHNPCFWNCNPSGVGIGDIYFTGGNTDAPDGWSFVIKTPVDSGTVLHITDNEWSGTTFNTGEGSFLITFTSDAPCGTEFAFSVGASPVSNNGSTATITPSTYVFEDGGDALYLIEGSLTGGPTSFISAIKMSSSWGGGGDNLTNTGLTNNSTAIDFGNDNGGYNCANGTNLFIDVIMNDADWTTNNGTANVLNSFCTWGQCVGSDIGIIKPDGTYCGDMINLVFYVFNNGPDNDPDIDVVDNFPGSFSNAMWSSSINGVMVSMGSGNINDNISLDFGDTIIYRVSADLPSMTSGTLMNTASVTGSDDVNPSNDSDTGEYTEYSHVCNPPLAPLACEDFNIILVLDASGSIDATEQQIVRDAAIALVNALTNTGVSLALVQFAHVGENAVIGSSSDYQEIIGDPSIPGPATGFVADFIDYINNNYPDPANVGTYTNWEDGFISALTLAPSDLMLYMTDGDPTAHNCNALTNPPCSNFNNTFGHGVCFEDDQADCEDASLAAAIVQADIVKSEGTHLYVFAVGGAPDLANIIEISGPMEDLCPDTDFGCINQNPTDPHFSMADFTTVSFQELAFDLANFAQEACQSNISIEKTVYLGHNAGADCPGSNLVFEHFNEEITFCFTITNIGNDVLEFTEFDDPTLGINVTNLGMLDGLVDAGPDSWPLSPGDVISYYYESTIGEGTVCNIAYITATSEFSGEVTANDTACVIEDMTTQFSVCGECTVINGPADPVCPGTISVFTASIAGLCALPVYTWTVTGNIAGFTPSGASVTVTAGSNCNALYTVSVSIACDSCTTSPLICFDNVLVQDLSAPSITCPPNTTVFCANDVPGPAPGSVTSSDNCGGAATITNGGDVISNQTCANRFTVTRTYISTDACGNSASCTQIITVLDNTGPSLSCPDPSTVACAALIPAATPGSITASDNCAGGTTITHLGDAISGQTCANRYTITRTYQAIDICGNTGTCAQTITVLDNTGPTLSCPDPMTVQCANLIPAATPGSITASDNCAGGTTITHLGDAMTAQTCANRFTLIRTYQAIDECGNTGTCAQTISVFDSTVPTLTCPDPVTLQCANLVPDPDPLSITSSDNCGGSATITHDGDAMSGQTCANRFTLIRTYRATDACGNSATCTQTITVFDDIAPTIAACAPNTTIQCANLVPTPVTGGVMSSDNCGGSATVSFGGDVFSNQTCVNRFTITRTYNLTDECGNSNSCTQTITVFDDTPPILTCPEPETVQCASLVPDPDPTLVAATDNCGGTASVTFAGDVISDQICVNQYTISRTYSAVDECGNSASCTQIITVFDDTPPTLMCPGPETVQCASLLPDPDPTLVTATDNCGGTASITFAGDVISDQTCLNQYTVTRTYSAVDECGNVGSCTQIITVFDDTPPTMTTCPDPETVQCANLVPDPDPSLVTATDNCGGTASITFGEDVISDQTCVNRYTITRTYNAIDECGNSASCMQIITVFDDTPPSVMCPTASVETVQCASEIPEPNTELVTATDNCGGTATITHGSDVFINMTCTNRFDVVRTYIATDECGNSASCTQTLSVFDSTPPTVTCPDPETVQCANLVPDPDPTLVVATDNCGGTASVTFAGDVISAQTCVNRYTITRTYNAVDECGNSASCTQIITVFDDTPPTVTTCPEPETVQCANLVPDPDPTLVVATDNCGGTASVTFAGDVISDQTCVNQYTITRTYSAVDECGNSASCTQIITVFDDTPPTLTCPEPESVQCANLVPDPDPTLVTATDNCGGTASVTFAGDVISDQICVNQYTITRTYSAVDECGNSASCTQIITVFDDTPPTVTTCPGPETVQCANLVPDPDPSLVTATDNCGGTASITFGEDVISDQTCVNRYTITRTYNAVDECGNSASCTQTITVFDDTPPTVMCPTVTSGTVQCASEVPEPNTELVTATDNCGGTATITHGGDVFINMTCVNRFDVVRTYIATDECGNSASCTQTLSVFDSTPPTVTCPEPETVQCANLVPDPDPTLVVATDNCGGTASVTFAGDAISGQTCVNRYTITRTYNAVDECGNSASCTQIITVFDDTPPTVTTCPEAETVQCANLVPDPDPTLVVATDNCGGTASVTFAGDVISGETCLNQYTITRTYSAVDECGNSASCTQIITVFDDTPPTLTCPEPESVQCANLVPDPDPTLVTATDNCGGTASVTFAGDVISDQICVNRYTITRTYSAVDECGNSASCTQIITVFDDTPPTVTTCPEPETVQCANLVPDPDPSLVTATDNCGGTASITFGEDVISDQTCVNRYTITRTYNAVDECGNSASCTQTITVFDDTPPTVMCPTVTSGTVQCASEVPEPNTELVTATDNCGGTATITHGGDVITNMTCTNRFDVVRTYIATDECGNSASCTQTLSVFDSTPPTVTCPDPETVQCANLVPDPDPTLVVATDNCGGTASVTFAGDAISGQTCVNRYTITRTYSAVDECGNSASCTQIITVFDDTPPTVTTCPEPETVQCANLVPDPDPTLVVATDNCGGTASVTFAGDVISGETCLNQYTITRTYSAVDECGNSASCTQIITVFDDTPPTLTCPEPESVQCANLVPDPDPTLVTATDNCGGTASVTFAGDVISDQICVNQYTITRTYSAVDECGNSASCTQIITVFDDTPPTVTTCPGPETVQCANLVPDPDPSLVTATDNCGGTASITFGEDVISDQTCVNRYTITRTYNAVDECGNSASCTQTITVFDDTPPTVMCPTVTSGTVQCASEVPEPNTELVTATDNCGGTATITHGGDVFINMTCVNRFDVVRTYIATDECGNSASCTQTLSVFDSTPPTVTCPEPETVQCANLVPDPDPTLVVATDNCGGTASVTFAGDAISGQTCVNRYTITRTYNAVDECGNSASCTQIITVFDDTPPTVTTCPEPETVQCANLVPDPDPTLVVATDNCGGTASVTFAGDVISGETCLNQYTITRTYSAVDECGNSASCTQIITVFDDTPPTLTCPEPESVQCANLVPDPDPTLVTATDNCGGTASVTFAGDVISDQICVNRYTITRTYSAVDECGNSASCTQSITVYDDTPPTVMCPTAEGGTVQCASEVPDPNIQLVTATDNCGGTATITHGGDVITNMTCANRFDVVRTYFATDECGNSASCTQTLTVYDDTPPTVTCPTAEVSTVQCASEVPEPNTELVMATDNCGGTATITHGGDVITNMTCTNRFDVVRTYIATDECGNSASCTQTLSVYDDTPPEIVCPDDVTLECDEAISPDVLGVATATDNCSMIPEITSTDVTIEGRCPQAYTIERTWTASDECMNSSSCIQTIVVDDTTPPSIECPEGVTVQCAGVLPQPDIASVTASDNCGIAEVTFVGDEIVNQTCTNRYNVNRTYQATDECGNSASCTQTFVVYDDTPPTLTCPEGDTVQCALDLPEPNTELVTATDNCGGTSTITHVGDVISDQTCANRYNVTRTYSATDECGNSASCTQIITVFDNTPPTVMCPTVGGGTVQCASEIPPPNIQLVTATDNCGGGTTITHAGDVMTNMTCANRFNVVRTYRATDECGNSASCTQTLTVFDNTPPTVTCPPAGGGTVQCANMIPAPNPALVTATDNCGGAATVVHAGDVITNMTCANRFNVVRTYTATDACGNSASCTQTITVLDNTAPTITCPANVSVQCAAQVPAVNPASVTSSENCAGAATVTHLGDVISNMTCTNRFVVTRTYRATDACGNSASCSQTITVFDNTAPTITCPPNTSVQCAAQVPPANPANVTSSDNCGATSTVTVIGDVISNMTCTNRFTVTRTYRATDACGNSASCSHTITVYDNTPPVITFTDPLLEGIPNGGTLEVACFGQDPEWDFPTFGPGSVNATDNCAGAVNLTYSSVFADGGNCAVDGYIILYHLTWTATDVCGNSSTAHVFVALVDEIPPVIIGVPDDITVNCDEIPEPPAMITAIDECLCACVVLFEEEGPDPGCQDGQVITRTWTAHDDCGNVTEETQNITLIDNDPPQILFTVPQLIGLPDGTILEYTCQEGGILELFDDLDAGSVTSPVSCGSAGTITFEREIHVANNCEFWGYVEQRTFHWHAVDLCGNESDLTLIARLIDTDPPILINVPEIVCEHDPSLDEVDAIDNCGEASVRFFDVEIPNPCGPGNEPAIRRTYEAFDDCGNFAVDTAILIPDDNVPPIVEFVNPILADLKFGEILIIDCTGEEGGNYTDFGPEDVTYTDGCGFGATVTFTETVLESRDCSNGVLVVLELRWEVTDICGNVGEALVDTAHITDMTSPVFVDFDSEVTIGCNDELPETEATDNCGQVTITYQDNIIAGPCPYMYDVMRKITASDPCGNTTIRMQLVHVGDGSGPTIEGVVPEVCDDLTLPNVTAFDECAGEFVEVTMTSEVLNTNCVDGFVIRRTWTAVDICGNVSSVTQDVIVGDTTAPVILIPSNSIINRYLDVLGPHLVLSSQTEVLELLDDLDDGSVFIIDDCDQLIIPQFTLDITYSLNCILDGFYEHRVYSWVASDACGNSDSISFFVNILPDVGPGLLGVPSDETVICQELPAPPIVTPTDNSIPVIIEFFETIEPGDGPGVFVVTRRWVARDPCGNETVFTQQILWIPDSLLDCDIVLPDMVECNTHGVVIGSDVSGGQGALDYEWEITGEKCFIQSGQNTPEITIYIGWSTVQIRLTVTDAYGCSNVCSATLDCVDSALDPLTGLPISTSPETILIPGVDVNQAGEQYTGYNLAHMNLWPNPANGNLSLSFESYINQEVEFTLTNLLGQVVLTDEIDAVKGFNSRKFDVSVLPEGSYLMQVKSQRDMYTEVIVVVHNK